MFWRPFELETDFQAFVKADGDAMRMREGYLLALSEKKGISNSGSRRLSDAVSDLDVPVSESAADTFEFHVGSEPVFSAAGDAHDTDGRRLQSRALFIRKHLTMLYAAKSGNALDERVLRDVRDFEHRLRHLRQWEDLCLRGSREDYIFLCTPGQSLSAVAWAEESSTNETEWGRRHVFELNAEGTQLLDPAATLAYLQSRQYIPSLDLRRFFPKAYAPPPIGGPRAAGGATQSAPPPLALRSTFMFRMIVGTRGQPMPVIQSGIRARKQEFSKLVSDAVYPIVHDSPERSRRYEFIEVFYTGDEIGSYEVMSTLMHDALLAVGSMLFVLVYLWFHTRTLFLSICCLLTIFASIPLAYAFTPASKTTIIFFLSFFLIAGIGSDVVFVFMDFWDQSAKTEEGLEGRISHMIRHAGTSCLATSLTTSVSFFANLASCLQPLREFGCFMGSAVMCTFLLVLLLLPPLVVFQEKRTSKARVAADASEPAMPKEVRKEVDVGVRDLRAPSMAQSVARSAQAMHAAMPSRPVAPRSCPCTRASRERRGESLMHAIFFNLGGFVARWAACIFAAVVVLMVVFVIGVAATAEMDQGVPAIFPSWHNQVRGAELSGTFFNMNETIARPPDIGAACDVDAPTGSKRPVAATRCMFHWCQAAASADASVLVGDPDGSTGQCWRTPTRMWQEGSNASTGLWQDSGWDFQNCSTLLVATHIASRLAPSADAWWRVWREALLAHAASGYRGGGALRMLSFASGAEELNPLVVENWELGAVRVTPFFNVGEAIILLPQTLGGNFSINRSRVGACEMQTVCFFGAPLCTLEGWQSMGEYNLDRPPAITETEEAGPMASASLPSTGPMDAASAARELQDAPSAAAALAEMAARAERAVPEGRRIDVTVVWGIRTPKSTPLIGAPLEFWRFDPFFEPSNPWAQRAILDLCQHQPEELEIITKKCWILYFYSWLQRTEGARFPTRAFDSEILRWYPHSLHAPNNLWFVDNKVKAMKVAFYINIDKDGSSATIMEGKKRWDSFVEGSNARSSLTANQAFHTAQAWVRAEAEQAIIASTVDTILISTICAFLGMLIFTSDPTLAFIVLFLVLEIICGLAFFITAVMGWRIGPVEVISLVVFVGYSVTYALHIAHSYADIRADDSEMLANELKAWRRDVAAGRVSSSSDADVLPPLTEKEMRRARTRMALLQVGAATLSSALSTMGSSVFLLFCTLNIFVKLGAVVMAVTVLSILFALVALPAAMVLLGPSPDPWYAQYTRGLLHTCLGVTLGPFCRAPGKGHPCAHVSDVDLDWANPGEPLVTGRVVD